MNTLKPQIQHILSLDSCWVLCGNLLLPCSSDGHFHAYVTVQWLDSVLEMNSTFKLHTCYVDDRLFVSWRYCVWCVYLICLVCIIYVCIYDTWYISVCEFCIICVDEEEQSSCCLYHRPGLKDIKKLPDMQILYDQVQRYKFCEDSFEKHGMNR